MARINMDGSDDPFYRYTMPALTVKVEGTTKMIKTHLTNINDVAAHIGRPSDYLVTYFGQELNSNSKYDKATQKGYVTGSCTLEQLQKLVFQFIDKFVKCGACGNPETVVEIEGAKKKKQVMLNCKSCGSTTAVSAVEKFTKFILSHPVEELKRYAAVSAAQAEKLESAKGKKTKKEKKAEAAGGSGDEDSPSVEASPAAAAPEDDDDDEEDWCVDTSAEAVAARRAEVAAEFVV